jgi:hypothetical protein
MFRQCVFRAQSIRNGALNRSKTISSTSNLSFQYSIDSKSSYSSISAQQKSSYPRLNNASIIAADPCRSAYSNRSQSKAIIARFSSSSSTNSNNDNQSQSKRRRHVSVSALFARKHSIWFRLIDIPIIAFLLYLIANELEQILPDNVFPDYIKGPLRVSFGEKCCCCFFVGC